MNSWQEMKQLWTCCRSYCRNGLQQTEVDADEPIEVFVRKPETLHIEVHLRCTSDVRHLLGQDLAAQNQWIVFHKVFIEESFCWSKNTIDKAETLRRWVGEKTIASYVMCSGAFTPLIFTHTGYFSPGHWIWTWRLWCSLRHPERCAWWACSPLAAWSGLWSAAPWQTCPSDLCVHKESR